MKTIEALGILAGTKNTAIDAATQFMSQYDALSKQYASRPRMNVFYEMSETPLLTMNKHNLASEIILQCGGKNIFADTVGGAPEVSVSSILALEPQAIIIGEDHSTGLHAYQSWQKWQRLNAVKSHHIFLINPDWISRAGPRTLLAMQQVCIDLDKAR